MRMRGGRMSWCANLPGLRPCLALVMMSLVVQLLSRAPAAGAPADRGKGQMAPTLIVKEDYHGWSNTCRMSNELVEVRVITDIGPRLMDFRPAGGANVLHAREG